MARAKRTTPEPEEAPQGTALALPDTPVLIAAYGDEAKMEAVLTRIETDALALAPDLSTVTSRKEIASLAFKVARSKTALDKIGAELIDEARKKVDSVNAKRKAARDRLDELKVKVRAPLDAWEAAEAARVADLEDRLKDFTDDLPGLDTPSTEIEATISEIEDIPIDDTWAEFKDRAAAAKKGTLNVLRDLLEKAKVRETERAELDRLRAEKAERDAADQRRLAEERRKVEAERIEREKVEAAERAAQRERERAEQESRDAEARHQREIAAAEARRERELSEAAERERLAVEAERQRVAQEQAKADTERRAREADQARRAKVKTKIVQGIRQWDVDADLAGTLAEAIMSGRIPHVKVEM